MTNPNIGRASVPTQQEVKILNAQDALAERGLDPSLGGFPNPNGDEKYQKLWLERADWITGGYDAVQSDIPIYDPKTGQHLTAAERRDTQRRDLRSYRDVLAGKPPEPNEYGNPIVPLGGFILPGQQWESPFSPPAPISKASTPEDRRLEHNKDFGKPRRPWDELVFGAAGRLLRRVVRGPEGEPMNPGVGRREKARWAAARKAGHMILDNGVAPQDDRSYDARVFSAAKGSYVHLDPNGPPVVEDPKKSGKVKYSKLRFRN